MPLPRSQGLNQRLLAAIFAAHPKMRLDYIAISEYYGGDATPTEVESRIRILRIEGQRIRNSHPRQNAEATTVTARAPMTLGARRNRKRFSKNAKKGYDSSSSSSSSESSSSSSSSFYDSDAPNRRIKKAKKAEDAFPGSKASKPICIDSEDDSSIATLGYGVQKIEDPPIIKKEMKSCPIKPENDPTTLTSTEPYLHRRSPSVTITGENPCVRYTPFMKVGGELSDPTVAKEPDNEKKGFLFSKRP